MDFIKLVSSIQEDRKLTDAEIAKYSGISEYTYYSLKKYRIYLSRVAYFALSCALKLPIEDSAEIDAILEENKVLVGTPESNLEIAAECVNPDYLDKMEKELTRLKKTLDTVNLKDKVIATQYAEIAKLRKDLEDGWSDLNQKIQEAYSNGVREGASKVEIMRASANQSMIMALNEEYTDKIDKLERALRKVESQYIRLYKLVNNYIHTTMDSGLSLSGFEKPLGLMKEELGMVVSEDTMVQILLCSKNMGMSVDEILQEVSLPRKDIEWVLENYKLGIKENRYYLEMI